MNNKLLKEFNKALKFEYSQKAKKWKKPRKGRYPIENIANSLVADWYNNIPDGHVKAEHLDELAKLVRDFGESFDS